MDEKRLQEIKRRLEYFSVGIGGGFENNLKTTIGYVLELITALEIQYVISEEMDKGRAFYRNAVDDYEQKQFPELKKQLAEAQAERDTYRDRWKAALERVEYYRYEMPELRESEM